MPDSAIRTFYRNLGRRVRDAREQAGITQQEIATRLGLTRASITNLEAGRQRISAYHLAVLADILDIPMTDLTPPAAPSPREVIEGASAHHLDLLQHLLDAAGVDTDVTTHGAA